VHRLLSHGSATASTAKLTLGNLLVWKLLLNCRVWTSQVIIQSAMLPHPSRYPSPFTCLFPSFTWSSLPPLSPTHLCSHPFPHLPVPLLPSLSPPPPLILFFCFDDSRQAVEMC
jgi:hypothetical protein